MTLSSSNYVVMNAGLLVNWQGCSVSSAVPAVVESNCRNPRNPLRSVGLPERAFTPKFESEYQTFGLQPPINHISVLLYANVKCVMRNALRIEAV